MRRIVHRGLLYVAAFLALIASAGAQAAAPEPLTQAKILDGLKGGVITPNRMATLVEERGVDFKLIPEVEKELRDAGANDVLIQAISKAKVVLKAALVIDTDADCTVTVNGSGFDLKAGEAKTVPAAVGENAVRAVSKRDASLVWRNAVRVQPGEQKAVLIELTKAEPKNSGNNAASGPKKPAPVEPTTEARFTVFHYHGGFLSHSAHGVLTVSSKTLQYKEDERGNPDHDFKVPCSEIVTAGVNQATPREGWFHIKLPDQNYNFAALDLDHPDQQQTALILKTVTECRKK